MQYQYEHMKRANDEAEWLAAMGRAAAEKETARAAKLQEELNAMKDKRQGGRRGGNLGGRRGIRMAVTAMMSQIKVS
jgi:hypothetical protein